MSRIIRIVVGTAGIWFFLALFASSEVFAVGGFARQTGMSCNQCHTAHGGATPNFTFSGKKFQALGFRLPGMPHTTQTVQEQGSAEDNGQYLSLRQLTFSARVQHTFIQNAKSPEKGSKWGDALTNPTSRLAFFPFIGPVGDHFGMWTEFYHIPFQSEDGEWGASSTSFEEMDFRYVFNPDNQDQIMGLAMTNQGVAELFGFGPWPAGAIGSNFSGRAGIGGYTHPNFATLAVYGWMNDRWVWALGANSGDTNYYWDRSNIEGFFGYAIRNRNDNEVWWNLSARSGNDALPLVTAPTVSLDNNFEYRDGLTGVSGTRTSACPTPERERRVGAACTYLAEEMDNVVALQTELRWSGQSVDQPFATNPSPGNWSYEVVFRLGHNTEEYKDGAKTELSTWGLATTFGWKHTYYFRPYIEQRYNFEFTDENGNKYDVDTLPNYGLILSYKPVEHFLINLTWASTQSNHLVNDARYGQRYVISTDLSF